MTSDSPSTTDMMAMIAANSAATLTNPTKVSGSLCFWMIVIATTVEADPMGVMLPPRLAPKMTLHQ